MPSSLAAWITGARPRTLPAAFAPVIAGTAVAWFYDGMNLTRAFLALTVALALQVGVNYANDYSDGIRGTDADRVGPQRLVASGAASPGAVKTAAWVCFGVAAVVGLTVVLSTQMWWLLAVGVASIAAAWFYTGGPRPYGYAGLGEVFVFVFFGLVAVCGTTLVQLGRIPLAAFFASAGIGALACAILVANNLRDIQGDVQHGKRTLATRLGDRNTRFFYVALLTLTVVATLALGSVTAWWLLLALVFVLPLIVSLRRVLAGATGPDLITVLKATGIAELVYSIGALLGVWLARL